MEGEREEIKKGPWKAEEDEVLINHVNKYGPRDWSSIRSKGLLQRTGKSCRLRWVNKLRPNLKNGCKFSSEEERLVIELQAQFGNKWARIATYLPGRTDNDVKNFWSSRQKRLARILQTPPSSSPSSSQSHKTLGNLSSKSSYIDNSEMIKLVGLPDMVEPNLPALKPTFPTSHNSLPHLPQPQPALTLSPESQELVARLDDPNFLMCLETEICKSCGKRKENPMTPDSFFDDFPTDMFDHMEPFQARQSGDLGKFRDDKAVNISTLVSVVAFKYASDCYSCTKTLF
ncbi:hypothetical protein AAG906_022924 [Vitis piasezkii]